MNDAPTPLTPDQLSRFHREIDAILPRFPSNWKQAAMLPALWLMQRMQGYLTTEAMLHVAEKLEVSPEKVAEVATFYAMFRLSPVGKYSIEVCTNLSCSLRGAEHVVEQLQAKLGIELGETSPDGKFTLREVECLASCGTAPCLQVNEEFFENLTPQSVDQLVGQLLGQPSGQPSGSPS